LIFIGMACPWMSGQPTRRLAIVEANGPVAHLNPGFALAESRVTDGLTAALVGAPGLTLVDRASIDKILKEQNFENSDRSSSDSAARIGKLLGVGQILLVQLTGASYTTHEEGSGNSTKTMGTVELSATARLVDVETGVILAQPTSAFQDSVLVSETSKSRGFQIGAVQVPARQKTSGGDPKVIQDNEWAKAGTAVVQELATKLEAAMASVPGPKAASALVAGIANGSVYINQGSTAGVKVGDKYQIVRQVSVGLNDPTTGKPIVQKQRVCLLTVVNVDEANASGTCQGGLPQSKDVAEPVQP